MTSSEGPFLVLPRAPPTLNPPLSVSNPIQVQSNAHLCQNVLNPAGLESWKPDPVHVRSEIFYSTLLWVALPNAFCKNTGHFDLSTVWHLSCVVFRKQHKENRKTISIVKPQLIICPHFGLIITFRCVCDVTIAPWIASQQQINFTESTVLTRFITWVNIIWEILR